MGAAGAVSAVGVVGAAHYATRSMRWLDEADDAMVLAGYTACGVYAESMCIWTYTDSAHHRERERERERERKKEREIDAHHTNYTTHARMRARTQIRTVQHHS